LRVFSLARYSAWNGNKGNTTVVCMAVPVRPSMCNPRTANTTFTTRSTMTRCNMGMRHIRACIPYSRLTTSLLPGMPRLLAIAADATNLTADNGQLPNTITGVPPTCWSRCLTSGSSSRKITVGGAISNRSGVAPMCCRLQSARRARRDSKGTKQSEG
jgi:hypothetical protein